MLDISVKFEGDRVIIDGLNKLAQELHPAIDRALVRSAKAIHRGAYQWLSGPKTIGRGKGRMKAPGGGYPVPVRTGHLRRMLNWLKPGESKAGDVGTFIAGPYEVVVYNSAIYADAIHEGKRSSAKYGPRRYLTDAFEMFNRGMGIQRVMEDEIRKAKAKAGLK